MPIAKIQLPDGRIAKFEVPEGTQPDEVMAFANQHFGAAQNTDKIIDDGQKSGQLSLKFGGNLSPEDRAAIAQDYQAEMAKRASKKVTDPQLLSQLNGNANPVQNADPTDGMSSSDKFLAGVGMGMTNLARGVGQRLRGGLPESLSDSIGLPTETDIAESRRLDAPLANSVEGKAGAFVGDAAPTMLLPGGSIAKAIGTGGLIGLMQPTVAGESVVNNTMAGATGGALGHGLIAAGGRLLRPVRSELSPELSALAQKAQDAGIDLNAAQITGSKPLKWLDAVMNDLPMTAAAQQNAQQAQRQQFNAAIAKTMGSQADNLGEDVMANAKKTIGGGIGDIANRNQFNLDNQAFADLVKNKFDAQRFETGDVQNIVNNYVDDFFSKVDPSGNVSGEAYRKLDSELGRRMRGTTNGDLKHALGQVRDSLRSGMDRSISPEDATQWQALRNQYRNMKLIEPVAAKSIDGNINPATLLGAAIKGDSNAAYRSSDLKDLGKIGKAFLQDMPSSGTAQRGFYQQMLTNPVNGASAIAGGMTGGAPGAIAGGLLSSLLTSGLLAVPVQKAMQSKAGKAYLSNGLLKSMQGFEDPLSRYLASPMGALGLLSSLESR